jgi:hypothetical protein
MAGAGYYAWQAVTASTSSTLSLGAVPSWETLGGAPSDLIGLAQNGLTDIALDNAAEIITDGASKSAVGSALVAAGLVDAVTAAGSITSGIVPVIVGAVGKALTWIVGIFSDERLKENINKVGEVDGLHVYTYNYK